LYILIKSEGNLEMKYMGSKARFAKELLPTILTDRKPDQWYVEPFAGGMNMIDKVSGNRLAADFHNYLIAMFKALVNDNWKPPKSISEELYIDIRSNKKKYPDELVGYVGFNSYGGKWFAGYRRDKEGKRDYWKEHYNNVMKQVPNLKGIIFQCSSFTELELPENSIIYCDPPYEGTTKYRDDFDYPLFWQWCRDKSEEGHSVYISEYNSPSDFECVWEKQAKSQINDMSQKETKVSIERLFRYLG
jgi:DNA adenine methylase